jgi:Tfp pilus assembly protein PilO
MTKTILSIVGLAIAGAAFFLYTQPSYDSVRALESEIGDYNQALQKATELQQLKQSLLSRFNAFNPADVDRLYRLLPDHVDNVRLVLELDNLAVRHGMALQNVILSNPRDETESGAVSAIGAGRQKYSSLTLKFTTFGSYENFRAFMHDLESSLRIVDLVSLNLQEARDFQSVTELLYRYDITVRTYWLK